MPRQSPRRRHRAGKLALLCAAMFIGLVAAPPARADLAGITVAENALSPAEQQLLAENPALQELATDAPELLPEALAIIAKAQESGVTGKGDFDGLDETDVRLLGRNPALLQVWRSSPEASADLLQLIRTAAGGRRTSK